MGVDNNLPLVKDKGVYREVYSYGSRRQNLGSKNMNQAYLKVKRNKGTAGIDGMSIEDTFEYLKQHGNLQIREKDYGEYPIVRF